MRRSSLVFAIVLVLLGLASAAPASAGTAPPLPRSMAATGDSITRAYDATLFGCFLADCPQYSWATGTSTGVLSQYRRILAVKPAIRGHEYNDARTGAKVSALPGQMYTAGATQGVDYVTVLMGANDLCTSSAATMTPAATFQSYVHQALAAYLAARPAGHIFISSIPNLYQLWSLLHTSLAATSTWTTFGICQSMLAASDTEAQRQLVVTREQEFNAALAQECAALASSCRWDGGATYGYAFQKSDISTVDYFHPSVSGQNTLAGITWGASYWAAR